MKKSSQKSQKSLLDLSQKTYITIIALLFAYSAYISTNPVVDVSSNGFDGGYSPLYNMLLITILVPIAVFMLFYKYISGNNKKAPTTSVIFYSTIYTLLTFVIQGVVGHYIFEYTFYKEMAMADWQFFSVLTFTYLASVFVVFGGLALSNYPGKVLAKKKR
jgi:uncharacterized membrane protein